MIDAGFLAAVSSGAFRFVVLVEIITPDDTVRMTTDSVTTVKDGEEFFPGLIGDISQAGQSSDISESGISISVSSLDPSLLAILSAANFVNSDCRVWLLAQEHPETLGDPYPNEGFFLLFDGVVTSSPSLGFGDSTTATIAAQSKMVAKNRSRTERYSDADQQDKYPGDLGLQYSATVANKSVRWPAASWFKAQG